MANYQPHRFEEHPFYLPALVRPEGPGYMPLYLAAQWIATRGGAIDIDPHDIMIWKDAFATLLARIASEEVEVVGLRDGKNEKIDGRVFAGMQVDYPFSETPFNLVVSEELFLSSSAYVDDDHWPKGFDDRLETKNGVKWSRLMVLKSDIARWWPFDSASPAEVAPLVERTGAPVDSATEVAPLVERTGAPVDSASPAEVAPLVERTGAPGRPTCMHLVEEEHRSRWQRGEAKTRIGAEAAALAEWLRTKHPNAPRLTPKTIANRLRHEHRRRAGEAQK